MKIASTVTTPTSRGVKLFGKGKAIIELLDDLQDAFGPGANFHEVSSGIKSYPQTRSYIKSVYRIDI